MTDPIVNGLSDEATPDYWRDAEAGLREHAGDGDPPMDWAGVALFEIAFDAAKARARAEARIAYRDAYQAALRRALRAVGR